VREDEIGDIEEAIEKALNKARTGEEPQAAVAAEESDPAPVMEALEVDDSKSGP
jgi:hypothetical protein